MPRMEVTFPLCSRWRVAGASKCPGLRSLLYCRVSIVPFSVPCAEPSFQSLIYVGDMLVMISLVTYTLHLLHRFLHVYRYFTHTGSSDFPYRPSTMSLSASILCCTAWRACIILDGEYEVIVAKLFFFLRECSFVSSYYRIHGI